MPARPAGCYRLRQRTESANLNHMIDTASVGQILYLPAPVRYGLVINGSSAAGRGVGDEAVLFIRGDVHRIVWPAQCLLA
ncbi:MAG: hypothetical protein K0S58_3221, partial [Nitrospira sp.]|nr:hypothetical protein [Nitrospira sp.]